jgi:hypothetical protein
MVMDLMVTERITEGQAGITAHGDIQIGLDGESKSRSKISFLFPFKKRILCLEQRSWSSENYQHLCGQY